MQRDTDPEETPCGNRGGDGGDGPASQGLAGWPATLEAGAPRVPLELPEGTGPAKTLWTSGPHNCVKIIATV